MGFVYWAVNAGGDWSDPSAWNGGALPGTKDDVTISTATLQSVTYSDITDAVALLTIGDDNFQVVSGSLSVTGTFISAADLAESGGSFSIGTTASIAGDFTQTGGSLTVGKTISIKGTAFLEGGSLDGNATVTVGQSIVLSNDAIGGRVDLVNAHLLEQTGDVTLGDASGIDATITNDKRAVYDLAGAVNIQSGAATARLLNAGTLAALIGTGTSSIGVSVTSTGTVSIATASEIQFDGPLTRLDGTITGGGTLGIGGGAASIAAKAKLGVAELALSGAGTSLTVASTTTLVGGLSMTDGSTFGLGKLTLTVDGSAQFAQDNGTPTVTGTGSLVTMGTTTLSSGLALTIGGSLAWDNDGTIVQEAGLQLGDSSIAIASLVNQAAGVFDIVAGGTDIVSGSARASIFSNAGTLEMTATGLTSSVSANLVSIGTISVASGNNLQIDGLTNRLSGKLVGAGQISLSGGVTTIAAGTAISVATLAIYGTSTTASLAGAVTVAGGFSMRDSATLLLGRIALTVDGIVSFSQGNGTPTISGRGTLVTDGLTTLASNGTALTLGSGATWSNAGTVIQAGNLTLGDGSQAAVTLTNQAGGVFDIAGSRLTIVNGGAPNPLFSNAGTLEMTAGQDTSSIQAEVTSTGTISVATAGANLEFDGPSNTIGGTITGNGQVSFGSGTTTLAAGVTINVATLALYDQNTMLALGGNLVLAGGFAQSDGTTLSLGKFSLTISGNAQFGGGNGAPLITGSGILITRATTTLVSSDTSLVLGATSHWDNDGLVLAYGGLQIGDSAAAAAALVNEAGGVFDIASANLTIANGSTPAAVFTNAGTLEMTAGGGTSDIDANLTSTRTISVVTAGDNLELDGTANRISGSLAGLGQLSFVGGQTTLAGGTRISVALLALYGRGATLQLGGSLTLADGFSQSDGTTLSLGANTLTLSGDASFDEEDGAPLITGTGTLVTDGTTTLTGDSDTALTVGGSVAWDNNGNVLLGGGLTLGDGPGVTASFVNAAGAVVDIVDDSVNITAGSPRATTFSNAGMLEITVAGSAGIGVGVVNTGTILAQGGALTFAGAITGKGVMEIADDGEIALDGAVQATQSIKFLDGTGTLALTLGARPTVAPVISGFTFGDAIDLQNVAATTATFNATTKKLTVKDAGTVVAILDLAGTFKNDVFVLSDDDNGGTDITLAAKGAASVARFVQAAAGFTDDGGPLGTFLAGVSPRHDHIALALGGHR